MFVVAGSRQVVCSGASLRARTKPIGPPRLPARTRTCDSTVKSSRRPLFGLSGRDGVKADARIRIQRHRRPSQSELRQYAASPSFRSHNLKVE